MPKFTIVCLETVRGSVEVEADTLEDAILMMYEDDAQWPCFDGKGSHGSIETDVDYESTRRINGKEQPQ